MSNSIGDRMKNNYESRGYRYLTRRTPVIVRLDGRAFHTFTRGFERPFDDSLHSMMVESAHHLCGQMQGFKCAYIQSDEVSILLTDYDTITTEAWFNYRQNKVESVSASIMTAYFNRLNNSNTELATFDSRAFNIPDSEVVNYFLWRSRDWQKNSITMFASSIFSHNELLGKNMSDRLRMCEEAGRDYCLNTSNSQRNGTWIIKDSTHNDIIANYDDISERITPLFKSIYF